MNEAKALKIISRAKERWIMSNVTISVRALATEARRLAQKFPDRVAACTYTKFVDEQLVPNCIVGTAAHRLGVSLDDLFNRNACGICHLATNERPEWLSEPGEEDEPYVRWLANLQSSQDSGHTWSEALAAADRRTVMALLSI